MFGTDSHKAIGCAFASGCYYSYLCLGINLMYLPKLLMKIISVILINAISIDPQVRQTKAFGYLDCVGDRCEPQPLHTKFRAKAPNVTQSDKWKALRCSYNLLGGAINEP